jgi:hypothetical protein
MPLTRTTISPVYLRRLALIAGACLFMAVWFLFDGLWTYPRQRERAVEYQRLKTEKRLDEWKSLAQERGWSTEDPGKPKSHGDIIGQVGFALLLLPPGLFTLFCVFRARGRWIELTETGLRSSWGRQLQFGQIVTLNKRLWDKKGIAKLAYRDANRTRQFVLDDWKFEADSTRAILCEVESHINADQIIGGVAESEKGAEEIVDGAAEPVEGNEP